MRLLRRKGESIVVTPDIQRVTEKYAILSHTWLDDGEEVLYHELDAKHKPGYQKIEFLLNQAQSDGLDYVWIDTCCIDKRNNSELGEALNRMYEWYANAEVCYAYLSDVPLVSIKESRWFTRGWTLQELFAPKKLQFFDRKCRLIGDRTTLRKELETITGEFDDVSLPNRFRQSLRRTTKKPEDISYCMIGLMGVSLTLCYGEGEEKARERLMEAIEKEHGRALGREVQKIYMERKEHHQKKEMTSKSILGSLFFDGMSSREEFIDDPYPNTCSWILTHPSYTSWADREFPILWIKAKAGAGKSTLMKFVAGNQDDPISFFFNARGTTLEQSSLGLYPSLAWQLISRQSKLSLEGLECREWTEKRLQSVLKTVILQISAPITFIIDALDEGEREDIQNMVYFLQDLTEATSCLSICFASRYYPGLTVKDSVELRLDFLQEHWRDIEKFIVGRLDADKDLQQQVLLKSNGVFLWTALVVPILNREISNGNVHLLHAKLNEIPDDINGLFADLVKDADDEFTLAIRILCTVLRPLTAVEFYTAVLVASGQHDRLTFSRVNETTLQRFVTSSTRGLAEVVDSAQMVQFIHQSVRDFLDIHSGILINDEENHTLMKNVCYDYVTKIPAHSRVETGWSFLKYTALHCMVHATMAQDASQSEFLRNFDLAKFSRAFKIVDYKASFSSRDTDTCYEFPDTLTLLLCSMEELQNPCNGVGLAKLLHAASGAGITPTAESIGRALNMQHADCAALLIEYMRDPRQRARALATAIRNSRWSIACRLLELGFEGDTLKGITPLLELIRGVHVDTKVVQHLLSLGISINEAGVVGSSPVSWAIELEGSI